MQAPPSRRIPAPRPGLTEKLRRFTAGPGHRCKPFTFLKPHASLQVKNCLAIPFHGTSNTNITALPPADGRGGI
ncbi:TPA: hypothetical protein I4G56_04210 [Enterobacter asburiae]|nr:hypothetical protein MC67_08030 [Enterobacter cloacae complex sp.]HAS1754374.1 hypothetical protein [Enterobacter asburiae]HAS1769531.1 hypothetical protein [Enterobacter asburiae]HAS1773882.1 hypothetical protein [Enterobacter asburiae]HAS1778646.1 hypothetical protein [Enterobacter asburiae]